MIKVIAYFPMWVLLFVGSLVKGYCGQDKNGGAPLYREQIVAGEQLGWDIGNAKQKESETVASKKTNEGMVLCARISLLPKTKLPSESEPDKATSAPVKKAHVAHIARHSQKKDRLRQQLATESAPSNPSLNFLPDSILSLKEPKARPPLRIEDPVLPLYGTGGADLARLSLEHHRHAKKRLRVFTYKTKVEGGLVAVETEHLQQPVPLLDPALGEDLPLLADGHPYPASQLNVKFYSPFDNEILSCLDDVKISLTPIYNGLAASREGKSEYVFSFDGKDNERQLYSSAIVDIAKMIVKELSSRGMIGVYVFVDPEQIDNSGKDLREPGQTTLNLLVCAGHVQEMHTVTQRKGKEPVRDAGYYQRLLFSCPGYKNCQGDRQDYEPLDLNYLNNYLYRVNRYPGRSVTAEITEMTQDGAINMDLLVSEDKSWHAYINVSNTGVTQGEGKRWIERFGFVDYQFFHCDDTLIVEYGTTTFDGMNSVSGSYEAPVWRTDRFRWRVDGAWSNFNFDIPPIMSPAYHTREWKVGPSVIAEVYQHKDLFVDARVGAYWMSVTADDGFFNTSQTEHFFLPTVGMAVERRRPTSMIRCAIDFESSLPKWAGTDIENLYLLGRVNANPYWSLFYLDFFVSSYLNPIGFKKENCCQPTANLVHEFTLSVQGQYAFDYRLIPQKEGLLGGLYTVRGYPQALVAGDTVFWGQAEYRWHFPRVGYDFKCGCPPKFYSDRDWDGFLRFFLDAGRAIYNKHVSFEFDASLIGTGVGVELFWKRDLAIRADVGFALKDVPAENYRAGHGQVYFSATWMF